MISNKYLEKVEKRLLKVFNKEGYKNVEVKMNISNNMPFALIEDSNVNYLSSFNFAGCYIDYLENDLSVKDSCKDLVKSIVKDYETYLVKENEQEYDRITFEEEDELTAESFYRHCLADENINQTDENLEEHEVDYTNEENSDSLIDNLFFCELLRQMNENFPEANFRITRTGDELVGYDYSLVDKNEHSINLNLEHLCNFDLLSRGFEKTDPVYIVRINSLCESVINHYRLLIENNRDEEIQDEIESRIETEIITESEIFEPILHDDYFYRDYDTDHVNEFAETMWNYMACKFPEAEFKLLNEDPSSPYILVDKHGNIFDMDLCNLNYQNNNLDFLETAERFASNYRVGLANENLEESLEDLEEENKELEEEIEEYDEMELDDEVDEYEDDYFPFN